MSQAPREIPGFYWDPETKRYYRVTKDHPGPATSSSSVLRPEAAQLLDLAHSPNVDHTIVGHFDSDIVALETLHDARMLLVGLLGGHRSSGRVHLCGVSAHGQLALHHPKPFATITLKNMSCWTATARPTSTATGVDVAIGSTRTVHVSHIDPTGRPFPTAVLTTLSDPLALHWSHDHRDLLYVGQRDGFVHLVDVRVPSVRTHLALAAVASIPPSVPVVPDTARTRGWIAQPTVPASPISAIQSHGGDVYALHRDGSLRALLPGHGAVEVVRPCPGADRGETLLYPLGMAATPMGVVAVQPTGESWVRVAGQKVVQVIGGGGGGGGGDVAPCPDLVAVPADAMSRHAFEAATANSDDFMDEFCNSVVGVHSNGFVFAQ
ncbi:hypothetical protein GGF31_004499 [Allomyces arbusculus]|nr:hypothetical protein GGF31_004499 [Allomyces arbusculus]